MSDISLQMTIKEENNHLFKRCVRKLLESTFILREKDENSISLCPENPTGRIFPNICG